MHDLIAQLQRGENLSAPQITRAVASLIAPTVDEQLKADFLKALREKGETAAEIAGFADALLAHAVDPRIDAGRLPGPLLDVCGTGGDRMQLFNVSTTSMFILAAGGAVVVKHGNRAITSQCGGADVLEELGVRIDLAPAELVRCVERCGIGFVFAPSYHPAFKAIAPVRRQLAAQGIPTVFNMLGPLLNPARPPYQLIGIFSRPLLERYADALGTLGRHRAWVVHGDGSDELTITATSDVREVTKEGIRSFTIDPAALGLERCPVEELRGGDRGENAALLVNILNGSQRGPKRDIVLLNAAAGFVVAELAPDLDAGLALAREQIDHGSALRRLQTLQSFS
jgi:anthranilate phosphoribosyltransferase